jgi:serine/threonine-protein kinase
MIGKTVSHYRILEKLGEGGMGVVYKAEDTKLKRTVALKFLSPQAVGAGEEKERFVHEARAAASLSHSNICTIHEIDESREHSFIAMEYVEGLSLQDKIDSGPLRLEEALGLAIEMAEGLQEAHEKGIVHRDIKPANVMITPKGRAKIMDFGLAKSERRTLVTQAGTTLGTIAYMSPEQTRGEAVDGRSDIWSLGAVLYEMVTGQRPFKGDYEQAVVYAILNAEPEPVTALRTGVPMELERIINKCLAKDPAERYQGAADLAADCRRLRREISERTSSARPATGSTTALKSSRAAGPIRRIPRLTAALVGVGAAIIVFVLAFDVGGLRGRLFGTDGTDGSPRIDSLAILPFVNTGSDQDTEYLSDEIPASIMNNLSRLPSLRVVPRSTVFRYRGRGDDLSAVGRELKVGAVVTGEIGIRDDRVNIRAELIDVRGDRQLWGDRYTSELTDIIELETKIAEKISDALRLRLTGEERARLTRHQTEDPEAYALYLKGRHFWNRRTEEATQKALGYFQRAIDKDPTYAPAYAGLADCYSILVAFGLSAPKEAFPKAKAAALKAIEIDDTLAEAHASLGLIRESYDWDWREAEKEYQRAIELNPAYATAYQWYSFALFRAGRRDEALEAAERAQELDPLSLPISGCVGYLYYVSRDYDEAIKESRKTIELDPSHPMVHAYLGTIYAQIGDYEQAIPELEKAVELSDRDPENLAFLGYGYAVAGMSDRAGEVLAELSNRAKLRYVPPTYFAMIHTGLGEYYEAFDWFDRACEARDSYLSYQLLEPIYDPIRNDPRFEDLMRRIGLDPSVSAVRTATVPGTGKIILAVLPFDNLSPDADQDYFSDGMTEEMISHLGRLQPDRLGVIARTTAMRYKNTDKTLRQIGTELGADYVLEGSVRKSGEKIRITAALVQARDETQVFTDTVEKELADVFDLQNTVAEGIAGALALELLPRERSRLTDYRPVVPASYEAYIKGRYHWQRRTDEDMRKSLEYFQEAIDIDPGYALAYAGLADACALMGINGHIAPAEIIPRAKAAAEKAVELDGTLAEPHATLGFIQCTYYRDWEAAALEFDLAEQLNPSYATTHLYRGVMLAGLGRLDQAIEEIKEAQQLDPLALMLDVNVSRFYSWNHEYDKAVEEAGKALELDPDFAFAHYALGMAYRNSGMLEQAIVELKKSVELAGAYPGEHFGDLGYAYALAGMEDEARNMLSQLIDQEKQEYVLPSIIAKIYIGLGDLDRAFEWLNKAEEERDCFILLMEVQPEYERIRSDPRYGSLLEKVGLPP